MNHPRSAFGAPPQGGAPSGPAKPDPRRPFDALALCVLGAALLAGCAAPEPWVKPYERERLADPIMKFSRESLPEKHREHVYTVREGARGATGVQGGGCGCN